MLFCHFPSFLCTSQTWRFGFRRPKILFVNYMLQRLLKFKGNNDLVVVHDALDFGQCRLSLAICCPPRLWFCSIRMLEFASYQIVPKSLMEHRGWETLLQCCCYTTTHLAFLMKRMHRQGIWMMAMTDEMHL